MSETAEKFTHLAPAAGRLGAVFARPKALAAICCVALAGLGWFALGVIFADMSALETFCRPLAEPVAWDASGLAVVALMWGAMTLAMMLPSAAPMILTYAEIADMAARKGERIVSPFVIASGYALVWLGFCRTRASHSDAPSADRQRHDGGERLILWCHLYRRRGLSIFRAQARLPSAMPPSVPVLLRQLGDDAARCLSPGRETGGYCLGCCWAMMLVMFAVGVMNVIWMAALGVVMTIEKVGSGKRVTYLTGAALIVIGVAFVLLALAAHWPPRVT